MKFGSKIKGVLCGFLSLILVSVAVVCVYFRLGDFNITGDDAVLMAAALTMSKGSYFTATEPEDNNKATENTKETVPVETAPKTEKIKFSSDYYNTYGKHKNQKKYPVYTKHISNGGTKYQNFYVKNSTPYNLNIGETLKKNLGFKLENNNDVQVLIYHTHTSESYLDCDAGYYYSDYYPRTSDKRYNVTRVGEAIAQQLKNAGIGVVHDTTIHDYTYSGSYARSRSTVEKYLEKYPKIKVTLDIHRDSIGDTNYKVKPTFTYKGKKGAQIMIMSGYNTYDYYNFPNWNYNLRFALKLQQTCETKYQGITRPLNFGNFAYNMNINTGSLLIEIGTDSNTLEEAVYSGNLLGEALAEVLQKNS